MLTGSDSQPGDQELVVLAQKGDHKAFEALVERYKQKAYRIAFDFARDREEAKDLSQEAFLRAFANIKGFDRQSSFYTWFYRILVNLCVDYQRRRNRWTWEPIDEETGKIPEKNGMDHSASLPDREAMAGELAHRVKAALAALPANQRKAFILKNHQGLSIREIAEIMQLAEGTIKVHVHRAVVALRQSLADFAEGEIE